MVNAGYYGSSPQALCVYRYNNQWNPTISAYASGTGYKCNVNGATATGSDIIPNSTAVCTNGDPGAAVACGTEYYCDDASWTLSGSTCTRADPCQEGTSASGSFYSGKFSGGYPTMYGGPVRSIPASMCDGTCVINVSVTSYDNSSVACPDPGIGNAIVCTVSGTRTKSTCSTTINGAVPVDPTLNKPAPPCASGQGVMSNSTGKVVCVDGATPGATTPPKVNKSQSTDTKSDGSQIITETTNTCTGEGACSTTTTTTVINNTAGQPGQAGTPGTSTKTTDKPAAEQSTFCAQNPNLQMCKGGMNEEATQKKVLEEIQKLTKPDFSDDSSLQAAKHSDDSQKALEDENKKFNDAAKGAINPASEQQGVWAAAMNSGWFTPIPQTNCTPFSTTFVGKTFTMNHCPIAAQISEIGGYAMWLMLVVGVFVMVTGGNKEGVA